MGFFDSLKGALGMSGISLKLLVNERTVPQGDSFEGSVIVMGGHANYPLTRLTVSLYQEWDDLEEYEIEEEFENHFGEIEIRRRIEQRPSTRSELIFENIVAENQKIPAKSKQEFNFELPIPSDAEVSMKDNRWYIWATADIPKAIDPSARENVEVSPDPRLWEIKDIFVKELGFSFEGFFNSEHAGTGLDFRPIGGTTNKFDDVKLFVHPDEAGVLTLVYMDEREVGWQDYFKTMTGGDIKEKQVYIKNEDIENGEAVNIFSRILTQRFR